MIWSFKCLNFIFVTLLFVSPVFARDRSIDGSNLSKKELHHFVDVVGGETIGDEFEVDLNDDEKPDYLIGDLCGNGGCRYHIFNNLGNGKYQYIGEHGLQRGQFEVLKTMHNGFSDILAFFHSSAETGSFSRFEFNGNKYITTASFQEVSYDLFKLLRPTVKVP